MIPNTTKVARNKNQPDAVPKPNTIKVAMNKNQPITAIIPAIMNKII